jgi:hypothetical protein
VGQNGPLLDIKYMGMFPEKEKGPAVSPIPEFFQTI